MTVLLGFLNLAGPAVRIFKYMAFNATENSANPVILKQYWTGKRYEEVSNTYFFSNMFSAPLL